VYRDFQVFDCDSHFMEPPDLWDKYFPQDLWDRRPVGSADRGCGVTGWLSGDRPVRQASVNVPPAPISSAGRWSPSEAAPVALRAAQAPRGHLG